MAEQEVLVEGQQSRTGPGMVLRPITAILGLLELLCRSLVSASAAGAAAALVLLTLVVSREVVGRYLFNSPWEYSLDLAIYLMMFAGFIGLAPTMRAGAHVRVRFLFDRLPARWQAVLSLVTSVLGLIFTAILTYQGIQLVQWSHTVGKTALSALNLPLYVPQALIPLGTGLLGIQLLVGIVRRARRLS